MAQKAIEIILLRQWASHMSLPIWFADMEGNLVYYNEPAAEMLGVRYDQAGDLPLSKLREEFQVTAADGSPMGMEVFPLAVALEQRRPHHERLRYCGRDNVWRDVEVTAFPFEGEGREMLGAVVIWWEAATP